MAIRSDPLIRRARVSDAPTITELLAQLGYPDEIANVSARIERLDAREDTGVLVVEINGQVTAVAAYQLMDLLERGEPHYDSRRARRRTPARSRARADRPGGGGRYWAWLLSPRGHHPGSP
jgi:hypothetical protein